MAVGGAPNWGVLLMAYGGPESLEYVEPFLLDIRGGRPTPPELVEEIRGRYARIGGKSPLLTITRAQAAALEARLNREQERFRVFVGMRHWHPYIASAVDELASAGLRQVVALCLAPHYSRMSIGAYFKKATEAFETAGGGFDVRWVEHWGDRPRFLDAMAENVRRALAKFPRQERSEVKVIFTAHSLPARLVADGDPYDTQLRSTAAEVARRVGEIDWEFCYQSAGAGGIDWLGPQIEERVVDLARAGCRTLLVAPVGFVADHVEILYDLDVEARQAAEAAGARLERTDSMNASPAFIEALAEIVFEAAA
ncbi:MAG: ferrochelatase [Acidobacteria bacterium]|nr:ferrochelatase [Acidobacteriota bacterium]